MSVGLQFHDPQLAVLRAFDQLVLFRRPVQPARLTDEAVVKKLTFSPSSRWLITVANRTPTLWDLGAGASETTKRTLHGQRIGPAAFSPDARWLATGSPDGTTRLWDLHNSTLTPVVLRGHTAIIRAVEFTADGRWLVTASDDMTARLWDMDLDRLIGKIRGQAGRDFTPEERETYHLEAQSSNPTARFAR